MLPLIIVFNVIYSMVLNVIYSIDIIYSIAIIREHVTWRIGARDKVRFWEDVWVDRSNLKTAFPRLYSISLDK